MKTLLFFCCALLLPVFSWAQTDYDKAAKLGKRLALVVGNATYTVEPLDNPERDAKLIASNLRDLGYEVRLFIDLNAKKFAQVIKQFEQDVNLIDADAVFFYAGHGIGVRGKNYLLPIDTNLKDADDILLKSIDVQEALVAPFGKAKQASRLIILDACRNDPSKGRLLGGKASGFTEMGAPSTLISFSTKAGAFALDGPEGGNSIFTKHLSGQMMKSEQEAMSMFATVRGEVVKETEGKQVPIEYTSLFKPLVLRHIKKGDTAGADQDENETIKRILSQLSVRNANRDQDNSNEKTRKALMRAIAELDEQKAREEAVRAAQIKAAKEHAEVLRKAEMLRLQEEETRKTAAAKLLAEREQQAKLAQEKLEAEKRAKEAELKERLAREQEASRQAQLTALVEKEKLAKAQVERDRLTREQEQERLRLAEQNRARLAAESAKKLEAERVAQIELALKQLREREAMEKLTAEREQKEQQRLAAEAKRLAIETELLRQKVAKEAELSAQKERVNREQEMALTAQLKQQVPAYEVRQAKTDSEGHLRLRGVRLPKDIAISKPASHVPRACAAFSGGWGRARWGDLRTVEVWVEEVSPDCQAKIVYALGGTSVTGSAASFERFNVKISDGQLGFTLKSGNPVQLELGKQEQMQGKWGSGFSAYYILMQKIEHDVRADNTLYAQEERDDGVSPTDSISLWNVGRKLPMQVPNVTTLSTLEMAKLLDSKDPPLLIDAFGDGPHQSLPNALWLPAVGRVNLTYADRHDIIEKLKSHTRGNLQTPIVVFERNTRYGWLGYHAVLRLIGLGYTNIKWYRGGLDAWHDAGLPLASAR
ncbi:MAG: hypothetical protein RLZZ502_1449 [Pseudomonadota bacterium]|jgi:PQQ-dependent catabolism-associated CXXCW motif protein